MNVTKHPYQVLMAEAARARELAKSPESQVLLRALMDAASAYWDFLDSNGQIFEDERVKATALVVTVELGGTVDVTLKDGPLDRVYGNGQNPDPYGAGPADIPHAPRINR